MTESDTEDHYLTRVLDLVPANDPVLSATCEPWEFTETNKEEGWQLALDLINTMTDKKGIGLAANQVGKNVRAFAMYGQPPIVCFNPRLVDVSNETVALEEGCLSYPGLYIKIKRPMHVRVRYQDADGETHTEKLTGMTARIFQHELDHLDGVHFIARASKFHRDQAFRKRDALMRKFKK